jgi:hypothetical protein
VGTVQWRLAWRAWNHCAQLPQPGVVAQRTARTWNRLSSRRFHDACNRPSRRSPGPICKRRGVPERSPLLRASSCVSTQVPGFRY